MYDVDINFAENQFVEISFNTLILKKESRSNKVRANNKIDKPYLSRTTEEIQSGELQWPFWTKLVVVAIGDLVDQLDYFNIQRTKKYSIAMC